MTKKSMGSTASLCAAMLALAACSRPPPASPAPARALDDDAGFRPARAPSGITLRLDRLFYGDGETATVTVDFGDVAPPAGPVRVALSAPGARDAELVELTPGPGGRHASPPIRLAISTGDATPLDGVLSLEANTDFYALYVLDRNEPAFAGIEEDVVFDLALFEAAAPETAVHVDPRVAASDDEKDPPPGAKAVGTLVHEGGFPVQVATEELIVFPRDAAQLQAFLDLSGGTVLSSMEPSKDGEPTAYLVGLDPAPADPAQLAALRALVGETGALHASNQGALDIYFLSLFYQLEGYPVAVNPRVQRHGVPAISPQETSTIQHTMQMHPGGCMPGDPGRPCVENVPALWAFTALWDADSRRVNTAVLDFGFAPNDDFRRPSAGAFVECDMTAGGREGFQCGSGRAVGPPTVGNSFFGDKSWHGTGVVTTAGGVVNNGFGAAGVAGQVMVPMMYRYDFASYAFEMGLGMRKATDDGASCINLSGGYPCRVLTATGPDLEICSARGRARICALVHAAAHATAATTCGILGPLTGGIACLLADTAAVATTTACLGTLAYGDVAGPMARGALYAHRNGVPVVVSAGNQLSAEDLPPVVRDLVDVSDNSSDRWEVMPAVLPTTISVGAVNMNLDHVEMVGDTVDIWAPIRSAYLAPQDVNNIASALVVNELGGTSGAAPYITGVIAMMQAINPSLDPNTPGLTDEDRRDIVERIRAILTAGASSFSNAELVALGYGNQPERRVLVDPLAAVQAAAIQADPAADFAAAGYDTSLNFNEASAPNDRPRDAIPLGFGAAETGTIVTIPGDGIPGPAPDEDWYTFSMPGDPNPNRIFETTVTLQHPPDPRGDIILIDSARFKLESRGPVSTYRVLGQAGEALPFRVRATPGGDNVYRLEVAAPAPALPEVAITAPLPGDTLCAGRAIDFTADVGFPRFPEISVAPSEIVWRRDGVVLGSGPAVSATLPAGRYAIEVTAFADARASSRIMIEVEDCPGAAPQPTITRPSADTTTGDNAFAYDGYDRARGMWFTEVSLAGSASDAEDGAIPDGSLVWTTDRSDLQVAALGTGSRITARLYSDTCTGTWHELTLSATDSDGNTRSARRRIFIWTLC